MREWQGCAYLRVRSLVRYGTSYLASVRFGLACKLLLWPRRRWRQCQPLLRPPSWHGVRLLPACTAA